MHNCTLQVVSADEASRILSAATIWNMGMALCMLLIASVQAVNTHRMSRLVTAMRDDSSAEMRSGLVKEHKKNGSVKMGEIEEAEDEKIE